MVGSPFDLAPGELDRIFDDDGVAYVEAHADALGIPLDALAEVLPCDSSYIYFEEEGQPTHIEEVLVKVGWTEGSVKCGRTLVIDSRRKQPIAVLAVGQVRSSESA
jgi:hypothetical protein